jgi:hypothetical protein
VPGLWYTLSLYTLPLHSPSTLSLYTLPLHSTLKKAPGEDRKRACAWLVQAARTATVLPPLFLIESESFGCWLASSVLPLAHYLEIHRFGMVPSRTLLALAGVGLSRTLLGLYRGS